MKLALAFAVALLVTLSTSTVVKVPLYCGGPASLQCPQSNWDCIPNPYKRAADCDTPTECDADITCNICAYPKEPLRIKGECTEHTDCSTNGRAKCLPKVCGDSDKYCYQPKGVWECDSDSDCKTGHECFDDFRNKGEGGPGPAPTTPPFLFDDVCDPDCGDTGCTKICANVDSTPEVCGEGAGDFTCSGGDIDDGVLCMEDPDDTSTSPEITNCAVYPVPFGSYHNCGILRDVCQGVCSEPFYNHNTAI